MNEEQIRSEIKKIQDKYYTPASKIANAIGFHQSLVTRFINNNLQENTTPSARFLSALENWLDNRMV